MSSRLRLTITLLVALSGVAGLNLLIAHLSNTPPRQLLHRIPTLPKASVVALGNSLMAAGLDESAFNQAAGLRPPEGAANFGLGATSPVEHLLLLRKVRAAGIHPGQIFYGLYDFQLTQANVFKTADLIGNRAMLYYVEPEYARQFYQQSLHDSIEFELMKSLPMFQERGTLWARVEKLRRNLGALGMPLESNNRFGRAADFTLLEAADSRSFAQQCQEQTRSPLTPVIHEIINTARSTGARISMVVMPMSPTHLQRFYQQPEWPAYLAHVRQALASEGVALIDASQWVPKAADFADDLHLATSGAREFSRRLAQTPTSQPAPTT